MNESKLVKILIRVNKSKASFVYFTLESNENLCFYSTLKSSMNTGFRDIEIFVTAELESSLRRLLDALAKKMELEFLSD